MAFKDTDTPVIAITRGVMSSNGESEKVPPSPADLSSNSPATLPAASLHLALKAARAMNVMSWSEVQKVLKRVPRLNSQQRVSLVVNVMDRMVAVVGLEAMATAMRSPA